MCGNENWVSDDGVTRFGNAPESDYGFHWQTIQDVEYDVVRGTLETTLWLLRHRCKSSEADLEMSRFGF